MPGVGQRGDVATRTAPQCLHFRKLPHKSKYAPCCTAGPKALPILSRYSLDAGSLALFGVVMARFDEHSVRSTCKLYESSRSHKPVKQPDESNDTHYAEMHTSKALKQAL